MPDEPTPVSRRRFLAGGVATGAALLGGPAFLAACGSSGGAAKVGKGGKVSIATWPLYLEDDQNPHKNTTVSKFEADTGVKVTYKVAVDDNDSFTTKYSPSLEKGKGIGYDVVVLTSWMASRWISKGWAVPLPTEQLPNKKNLLARHQNPSWDAGRKYSLPFAEGQVGIAYYPDKVGGKITKITDLLDPKLKGRVTLLSEMRDTLGLFMLADGVDPSKATVEQAKKSIDTIKKARDANQFRKITGNSYTEDVGLGDVWAAVAWSGDVASLKVDHPDLEWVLPADGAMSFVDTMIVPLGAKNVENAGIWMNYLYDPKVSGPLFEAINYVSPVEGASASMSADAAKNELINPPAGAKIYEFRDLNETEAADLEKAFADATQL